MFPILHRLIYGLISGLTEFLPVGSQPHQKIYQHLTGFSANDPWLKVFVLFGAFAALLLSLRKQIATINEDKKLYKHTMRRRQKGQIPMGELTDRLYKIAMIPMLVSVIFYGFAQSIAASFPALIILLFVNGLVLILPRILPAGNKDGRTMSRLDGFLIGLGGAVGVLPGISRVGCGCAIGEARGGKPAYVLDVVLLATVIPFFVFLCFSTLGAISYVERIAMPLFLTDIGSGVLSFAASIAGIRFIRWFCEKLGLYKFAFYSWVFSVVVFILYMFV